MIDWNHTARRRTGFTRRATIALTALFGLTATILAGCPSSTTTDPRLAVRDSDHVLASGSPTVTVIEYGDFQCPVCGRFFRETYSTIKSEYVDAGKVRWVFRHFPLTSVHPNALSASIAAECAGQQNEFFAYHDQLFVTQDNLEDVDLKAYADATGLDVDTFNACFDGRSSESVVQQDIADGQALGVNATPTFFINGEKVVGFQSIEQMRVRLDAALAAVK